MVALANADGAAASSETNGELKCNSILSSNGLSVVNPGGAGAAVDDSGTESGEEANQKILVQVQGALANLESALPALDPLRRSSVAELLTKIQTSLKLSSTDSIIGGGGGGGAKPTPPPRKCWNKKMSPAAAARQDRHTVGVSSEELQDARRWLLENGFVDVPAAAAEQKPASARSTPPSRVYDSSGGQSAKTFRPVKFVPPPPKRSHHIAVDYIPEPSLQSMQSTSFACPPLQHVIVEHLDKRRQAAAAPSNGTTTDSSDSSDDGEDAGHVSSAQRLLQFASTDHARKQHRQHQGKRVKLKRGGSGGSAPGSDFCSADEDHSSEEESCRSLSVKGPSSSGVPAFQPKTANDKKYLALLRQAKDDEAVPTAYNPLHGKLLGNWGNRFGRIKTTFERCATSAADVPAIKKQAKTFWHDICKCPSDDNVAYRSKKPASSFKPVWSGQNGFSHATKSAFKPVAQKPPPLTGFVTPPEPPKPVHPKHLPLYNSSVTTAHRPFIYGAPIDDRRNPPQQWSALTSPASASDVTGSCSASPCTEYDYYSPLQPSAPTVSRVMGSPQTANIVKSKTSHRSPYLVPDTTTPAPQYQQSPQRLPQQPQSHQRSQPYQSSQQYAQQQQQQQQQVTPRPPTRSPRLVPQQRSPTSSPVRMPSVLQKSESWHQIIMGQSKAAVRSPQPARRLVLAPPQERSAKDQIAYKQQMVRQHLLAAESGASAKRASPSKQLVVKLNDDIDKVDDTFESLFKEATKKNKK